MVKYFGYVYTVFCISSSSLFRAPADSISHAGTFFCVLERESDTFDNFLKLLGDRIVLKGWSKFRGGLDAKSAYEIS